MNTPSESKKQDAARKTALRVSLPHLLARANSGPEAAQAALQACVTLKKKPPAALTTNENIAAALSPVEISRSLAVLSQAKNYVDLSIPLTALRVSLARAAKESLSRKAIGEVSRAIVANLIKISGEALSDQNAALLSQARRSPQLSSRKPQL